MLFLRRFLGSEGAPAGPRGRRRCRLPSAGTVVCEFGRDSVPPSAGGQRTTRVVAGRQVPRGGVPDERLLGEDPRIYRRRPELWAVLRAELVPELQESRLLALQQRARDRLPRSHPFRTRALERRRRRSNGGTVPGRNSRLGSLLVPGRTAHRVLSPAAARIRGLTLCHVESRWEASSPCQQARFVQGARVVAGRTAGRLRD